ncbi:hypothetical protein OKW43_008209 [Paraburkholderia sp. WC7.3g]
MNGQRVGYVRVSIFFSGWVDGVQPRISAPLGARGAGHAVRRPISA